MRSIKTSAVAGILFLGFGLGLVAPFSLYSYGQVDSRPFRVNRVTGVQQFATAKGWATTDEIERREVDEAQRTEAELAPEIAHFGDRLASMRAAERDGRLRKIEVVGRSVSAYFRDGRREQYYAIDLDDPRLNDVQSIAQRLSQKENFLGATAGTAGE